MTARPEVVAGLARLGGLADSRLPLAEAAILLAAAVRPGLQPAPYRRHVARLAADVGAYAGEWAGENLDRRAESLNQVIARRYGYGGATDASADLALSIDRRVGPPLALAILYLDAARSQGWAAVGVDFPAGALVRLEAEPGRLLLDPATGRTLEAPELRERVRAALGSDRALRPDDFAGLSDRALLVALQRARQGELEGDDRARLAILETLTLIAPEVSAPWREWGLLALKHGDIRTAARALERWLGVDRDSPDRQRTWALVRELNGRLA